MTFPTVCPRRLAHSGWLAPGGDPLVVDQRQRTVIARAPKPSSSPARRLGMARPPSPRIWRRHSHSRGNGWSSSRATSVGPTIHECWESPPTRIVGRSVRHERSSGCDGDLDLAPYLEPCSSCGSPSSPAASPRTPGELSGHRDMRCAHRTAEEAHGCRGPGLCAAGRRERCRAVAPAGGRGGARGSSGKTRQEIAANAATLLERLGADTAGVVMNDAREFAIPLPKRSMYAPTRKMRKAATLAGFNGVTGNWASEEPTAQTPR